MVGKVFLEVINMSLTASVVIVAVVFARLLLKKAPKIYSYVLWSVVLFRLLCPFSFSADFSLFGVVESASTEQGRIEYISGDVSNTVDTNNNMFLQTDNDALDTEINAEATDNININSGVETITEENSIISNTNIIEIGAGIWLAGILVILTYSIVSFVLLKKKLKDAVCEKNNIYITTKVKTPFVCGVLRPRIYLPEFLNESEKEYILLHERLHIKRCDHIVKLVAFGALCLHWFNPLVWVAFLLSGTDMEMSCDEAVIKKLGNGMIKDYSTSLLTLATGRHIINGTPLAFGEGDTSSRIKNVLSYKKPAIWVICIAVVVCVVLGVFLSANPPENNNEKANGESESYIDESKSGEESTEETTTEEASSEVSTELVRVNSLDYYEFVDEVVDYTYNANIYNLYRDSRSMDVLIRIASGSSVYKFYTTLEFAEDCVYSVSYDRAYDFEPLYSDASFDTFADIVEDFDYKNCELVVENNKITTVYLRNAYGGNSVIEGIEDSKEKALVKAEVELLEYYEWLYTKECDIADCSGVETVEVYSGQDQYGDNAMFVIRDEAGDIIYYEQLDYSCMPFGYHNIYLGEIDGISYIFIQQKEERYDTALWFYEIFRFDENGESVEQPGSGIDYNPLEKDEVYYSWVEEKDRRFENCEFILGVGDDRLWFSENIAQEYVPADYY